VQVDALEVRRRAKLEQAKARSLEELRAIGAARGYRPGWADHVWRARQQRAGGWR
jgi:hypothetical protein